MRTKMDVEKDVARITIDDGKVNAMSAEMLDEISARLEASGTEAQATVIRGRPGIFSAGFDMPTFSEGAEPIKCMLQAGMQLIVRMLTHPHPIVVACTGHAFPMGAFLMMCADVRYATRGDFKIGMNEVAIGLTVPRFALELAKHRLSVRGYSHVATGTLVGPEEAKHLGYVDYVVDESNLFRHADEKARALLQIDAASYIATKARMYGSLAHTIGELATTSRLDAELAEIGGA